MADAYKVIVDTPGCKHCKANTMWTIEGPDGIAIGRSFGDEEHTQDLCDDMNMAYEAGLENQQAAAIDSPELIRKED